MDGGDNVHAALSDVRQNMSKLGEKMSNGTSISARETVTELAKGIDALVKHVRSEQETIREWADAQAAQQAEIAVLLRRLLDQLEN